VLRQNLSDSRSQSDKITISTNEGVEFYEINQIVRIESSSNYSKIYFKDGKNILVTKLLKDFEEILLPYRFFRIHNSHLINLSYIKKYIRGDGGQVVMQNNEVIDVSRRKKEEFLKLIS
jgi:two-component system LytT family response regulator